MDNKKIITVIIDDEKSSISQLSDELATFSDVKVVKKCTDPLKAKAIIREAAPDLLFLDVEMPGKNGFELLHDLKDEPWFKATVVFHTAYDKYLLAALREAAFDYLLKPVQYGELSNLLTRFQKQRFVSNEKVTEKYSRIFPKDNQKVFLPTFSGLRFVYKDEIVLFSFAAENCTKACWHALLADHSTLRLSKTTNANKITEMMQDKSFFKISQSAILNLQYLNAIEFKTRRCLLIPPFDREELVLSRSSFNELKEKFELL